MTSEYKRLHVWISGRVQGVFFRDYTRREASALGLRGWVRNLSDGRVEALLEGPAERLDAMLQWCSEGSPLSRVDDVESRDEPIDAPLPPRFEIRY